MKSRSIIHGPGEGRRLDRYTGGELVIKLSPADDGSPLAVLETTREAGERGGPSPHRHSFLEIFYVLEGGYDFQLDGRSVHAEAGTLVKVAPDATHSFRSDGVAKSRILVITVPAGLERFFEDAAALATGGEMTEGLREVGRKHGIEFL